MYPENFDGRAGEVIKTETEKHGTYYTFIPKRLPVELDMNDFSVLLEEAARQLGRLNGMTRLLPNPYLLTKPYTQKEAIMSSRIEGTQTSFEEVLIAEAGGEAGAREGQGRKMTDLLEVRNLVRAIDEGVDSIRTRGIDMQMLLRLHMVLMEGVRGSEKGVGRVRSVPNWIGPSGTKIQDAKYVPPPPGEVEGLLANLLEYFNAEDGTPKLVKIAMAHYQFEAIHPFEDGNGRIGRLLVILYLIKSGLLETQMLYLSEYFERNRTLYYDLLFKASQKGAYGEWVSFFLSGIIEQSRKVMEKATQLLEFSDAMKSRMKDVRSRHVMDVFDSLLSNPYVTITGIAKREGISYPSAKLAVEKLVGLGALSASSLKDATGRGKIFASEPILKILND